MASEIAGLNRVLFVTDVDLAGGSGQSVATLEVVRALARREDVELHLVCPRPRGKAPEGFRLPAEIDDVQFLPPKRSRSVLWGAAIQIPLLRILWRKLREGEIDQVVVRRSPTMLVPPLLAGSFGVQYILLARGVMRLGGGWVTELMIGVPARAVDLVNHRIADRVFVAFAEVKALVDGDRRVDQIEAEILPNAVDPETFRPSDLRDARCRLQHFGIAADALIIGFVGSLRERHSLDVLLHSVSRLRSRFPEILLLVVGDGPKKEEMQDLARSLGIESRVIFTGHVQHHEVPLFMSACDVLATIVHPDQPSNPIKLYEYLACARPVVVSSRPELAFVEAEGVGRLVQIPTVRAVGAEVAAILEKSPEDRCEMGAAGRRFVIEHHTWERFAAKVVGLDVRLGGPVESEPGE